MSALIHALPRRSFVYGLIAAVIATGAVVLGYTFAECLQGIGETLVVCELAYRSTMVLWKAYRYGLFAFVALAGIVAILAARSLIGGVSDDLAAIIIGFGVPIFIVVLTFLALLVFLAGRSARNRAPDANSAS
ncbi:MAG: hypothetical protein IT566_00080 [Rhodospirillaceae bacterium]|nr:hypothetical protein [Rhodospirillaceae bacterium]